MKKTRILMLSIAIFIVIFGIFAFADKKIQLHIDGEEVSLSENIVIEKGHVLLPYALIGEKLGAKSQWNANEKSVTMTKDGNRITVFIGRTQAEINGKKVEMEVAPVIRNKRTMVPLRFAAESLSFDVNWNSKEKIVSVNTTKNDSSSSSTDVKYELIQNSNEYPFLKDFFEQPHKDNFSNVITKEGYSYALISYGEFKSGGYSIIINSVKKTDDGKIVVDTDLKSPPPGSIVTAAFSYPKLVVRLENQKNLPVIIQMKEIPRISDGQRM